jgi:shikimate dehydrogenase
MITINKDTKIYGSFSEQPGNNGCLFFNEAFERYNINAIYKSFYSDDIKATIQSVKYLQFGGFALSRPNKVSVIELLDELDIDAEKIGAVNTVVINDNKLIGYNTDWIGVYDFLKNKSINHINIIGTGGFGKAIMYSLSKLSITFSIVSRNNIPNIDDVDNQYFINATPIEIKSIKNKIIDLRPHTEDGKLVSKLQAMYQFKLYTGIDYENS